jgi:hypothetical protein
MLPTHTQLSQSPISASAAAARRASSGGSGCRLSGGSAPPPLLPLRRAGRGGREGPCGGAPWGPGGCSRAHQYTTQRATASAWGRSSRGWVRLGSVKNGNRRRARVCSQGEGGLLCAVAPPAAPPPPAPPLPRQPACGCAGCHGTGRWAPCRPAGGRRGRRGGLSQRVASCKPPAAPSASVAAQALSPAQAQGKRRQAPGLD